MAETLWHWMKRWWGVARVSSRRQRPNCCDSLTLLCVNSMVANRDLPRHTSNLTSLWCVCLSYIPLSHSLPYSKPNSPCCAGGCRVQAAAHSHPVMALAPTAAHYCNGGRTGDRLLDRRAHRHRDRESLRHLHRGTAGARGWCSVAVWSSLSRVVRR